MFNTKKLEMIKNTLGKEEIGEDVIQKLQNKFQGLENLQKIVEQNNLHSYFN